VRSAGFIDFVRALEDYGESRAWRDNADSARRSGFIQSAVERGAETLDARLEKAARRAKHLDELDEKERHKLRIALKKLRYSAEFFAPLFKGKRVARFIEKLSGLQDAFGDMNDAATIDGVLHRITGQAPDSIDRAPLNEATAFVYGWHRARVERTWKKARERWRDFDGSKPFWRN
jgi:CHAD domain-containing protein